MANRVAMFCKDKEDWLKTRTGDLTSTDIPALFDASPYKSRLELWHEKKSGVIEEIKENENMKWGNRLEGIIAASAAVDMGWSIEPMREYIRMPELRLGSSFDYRIDQEGTPVLAEIKNVDKMVFWEKWIDLGDRQYEAPPHIEFQVQHQLLVSGFEKAYIVALVGGNRLVVLERLPNQKVHDAIIRVSKEFWDSIDAGVEPSIDWDKDAEFVCKLFSNWRDDITVESTPEVEENAIQYDQLGETIKLLKEKRTVCKAKILKEIGEAKRVRGEGFTITRGKSFRVNKRKEKA